MTPEEEIARAERARQILEDDLFKAAIAEIEEALLLAIRKSAFADEKLREKAAQRYAILHDLLGVFKTHIETGKFARRQLEERNWQQQLKDRFSRGAM